jgi:hypothetical protein
MLKNAMESQKYITDGFPLYFTAFRKLSPNNPSNNWAIRQHALLKTDCRLKAACKELMAMKYSKTKDDTKLLWKTITTSFYTRCYRKYNDRQKKGILATVEKVHDSLTESDEALVLLIVHVKMKQLVQLVEKEIEKEKNERDVEQAEQAGEMGNTQGEDGATQPEGDGGNDDDDSSTDGDNEAHGNIRRSGTRNKSNKGRKKKDKTTNKTYELHAHEPEFNDTWLKRVRDARVKEREWGWYQALIDNLGEAHRKQDNNASIITAGGQGIANPELEYEQEKDEKPVYVYDFPEEMLQMVV